MLLDIEFELIEQDLAVDFGAVSIIHGGGEADPYTGSYEVIPKVTAQTMGTRGKLMAQDVNIEAIPYYAVSNTANGKTVIIGG